MIGFVNINKPLNMTSNDVVVKVRGILKAASGDKKLKVGHLGTLDPLATGVLPIAVGKATRLFDLLLEKQKRYVATFKFGETTPTLDAGSDISEKYDIALSTEEVAAAAQNFVGEIEQIPPQFSAKSVGGKRAYDIARSGGVADLQPKKVTVYSIEGISSENLRENEFAFKIVCSSGTYIRALARDIAKRLGTVGYMTSLLRESSGEFDISDSVTIDNFAADPTKYMLAVDYALKDFPAIELSDEHAVDALNGIAVQIAALDGTYVVKRGELTVAIGEISREKLKLKVRLCE